MFHTFRRFLASLSFMRSVTACAVKSALFAVLFALTVFFSALPHAFACSEVFFEQPNISARNFDFMTGDGRIIYTPRGTRRSSLSVMDAKARFTWSAAYGSVLFSVRLANEDMPDGHVLAGVDGMNEKGFKVGTYFLADSKFSVPDERPVLGAADWAAYLLDTFATVKDAVQAAKRAPYRVVASRGAGMDIKLHLWLHDPSGDSAILEWLNGELVVTEHPSPGVLTNSPYRASADALGEYAGFGGDAAVPGGHESMERFVRGAYYMAHVPGPDQEQPAGGVKTGLAVIQLMSVPPNFPHGCTRWTVVSSMKDKVMQFRTLNDPNLRTIHLGELDFSAGREVCVRPLGDVSPVH